MERNNQPSIGIDLKKYRIRIHKTTLSALGRPDYIALLINPAENELIIHKSAEEDFLAHKVKYQKLREHPYELYSRDLIRSIMKVWPFLEEGSLYIIPGTVSPNGTYARFLLKDADKAEKKEGRNDE